MGTSGPLQRRRGGQGGNAPLPDAEPQVQGRREGGPDHPRRVHARPAPGGQVHRHHGQGQGDEDTVQRPRRRGSRSPVYPRKRHQGLKINLSPFFCDASLNYLTATS